MTAITPVGMNSTGQFVISNPGDTLTNVATVANSGSYNDLLNQPTIPAAQVNSDWNAVSGLALILNKPSLSAVATTGNYTSLSNTPTIPAAQVNSDWNVSSGIAQILNKPSLATVATTGSYNSLSNTPTIPAAQVNSDWNAVSGLAQILNKPTLATVATTGSYNDLSNQPTIPSTARTTSALTLSLVGTGATGTQISSTKNASIYCCVSTSTTSTIGGPSTSVISLKICATNNATEGSWTTVATSENDQTITLAIALQSIQLVKGQLYTDVPAGWYAKLVNSGTGTHTETFISGQQTIYG